MSPEKRSNIKIKVVLGYILVFLAIVASLFIANRAYNKLLHSVAILSKPDIEITRMNRVLTNLSEAENKIRVYSLTREEKFLENFYENILEIQNDLDSLRIYSPDSSRAVILIDSMDYLLEERAEKLEKFVKLKQSKERVNLSQNAMRQLSEATDSAKTQIKTTTTKTTILDTVKTAKKVKPKKNNFFNRLLGKKEKVDTLETVIERTEVQVDTSYLPQSDSLLMSLQDQLERAQEIEKLNREIVYREELRLVEENTIIWDKIKLLLRQLESERFNQLQKESDKAKQIASNTISIISIIIIVGLVLGVLFIIFILTDISKSNYYRSELIIAKGKAEKLAKIKEDFLATMSHEIRTPLNAIIGFTNQLDKTSLEKKQKNFVSVLKSSSKHLLGLVNEILDLSKIEAGKLHVESINFNPQALVYEVYDLLKVNATNKNLSFEIEYTGENNIRLLSDPFRIKQILLNLGSNAIKFTEEGQVMIRVSVISEGDSYLFEVDVEDTGIGIAEDKQESIFEDFSQADSFSARKYGGTGLGLAISRRLAVLLGGDLFVDSELKKGSTFTLRLPLKEAIKSVEETITQQKISISEELKDKHFLIADDDDYSLLLLQTIFNTWNLKAEFVDNGEKAWNLIQKNHYDMILTDIHMPKMGGIELCRKVRELNNSYKDIPIVALTANVLESDLKQYISSGMTECLVKPFDEELLRSMISELLLGGYDAQPKINDINISAIEDEPLFDLSQIKQFTSDDPELIKQILNQFINSAKENLKALREAADKKNYLEIGSIAHKMLSSFNQLKVVSVAPLLKELEDLLHKKSEVVESPDYINELVDEVEQNSQIVISSIADEMVV
ncbi:ATP-binding protein [Marinifilum sp. D714]|uniref:hybrid sensor histidine kinase/response regulator n=1 Tax=Marinifilum sp. D714 TaxID=2937523 RepID=UPI0027CF7FA3|nr:ATP-binding protein [Marinifilum sp. D714]MDQ2180681.1 ATP-binding protein [Marinifilum sp. D714]